MISATPCWRSLLFVGADQKDRIAKVAKRGADAVILDLEDAVPMGAKAAARTEIADSIAMLAAQGQRTVVRINAPWREAMADIDAAACSGVDAVMVPGCAGVERLVILAEMLGEVEAERGLPHQIGIVALVESAAGLMNLSRIAEAPRVMAIALGTEDLALDMGVAPTPDMLDLPARQIALVTSARKLMALSVPISIAAYADTDAYRRACLAGRAYGVNGAICVHPDQVAIANEMFRPNPREIDEAQAILDAWDLRNGKGVISIGGRMVDLPVVERARRILMNAAG